MKLFFCHHFALSSYPLRIMSILSVDMQANSWKVILPPSTLTAAFPKCFTREYSPVYIEELGGGRDLKKRAVCDVRTSIFIHEMIAQMVLPLQIAANHSRGAMGNFPGGGTNEARRAEFRAGDEVQEKGCPLFLGKKIFDF